MKSIRKIILSICVILAMIGLVGCDVTEITPVEPQQGGNTAMEGTFELLNYMPKDQNYMVSPFSLKMAMMLAANGAEGETQSQILKAFNIEDIEKYNDFAKETIEKYNSNEYVKLNVANSIWLNTDIAGNAKFNKTYKDVIAKYYSGVANEVNASNAVKSINDWIAKKTNDKIKNVLSDSDTDFLAALVNTIYFKGEWTRPFEDYATTKKTFTDRNGQKTEIDFMRQTEDFKYMENDDMQMVRMAYKDGNTAMYIALPKEGKELSNIEDAINEMRTENVNIQMPKFKTEFQIELNDILNQLGITEAFNEYKAQFKDKMFENLKENAYISKVLQKTFIDVDEGGTEAAAATVVLMEKATAIMDPVKPKSFIADRPFVYFIRDDASGEILFLGEYAFAE